MSIRLNSNGMKRVVQPEILDRLPEDHPDALHNRRDLAILNRVMGNFSWFDRNLRQLAMHPYRILEIGAGTGELAMYLKQKGSLGAGTTYAGLDLCSRPAHWCEQWERHQIDISKFERWGEYDVVLCNLILHQFEHDVLERIGHALRGRAKLLLINEPTRHKIHLLQLQATRLLGFNYVSLHDGAVSIRAGFRKGELEQHLGLQELEWNLNTQTSCLGAIRLCATRK